MESLVLFIVSFIIVYLFYFFFVILFPKKRERLYKGIEATFLIKSYKIKSKTIENKNFCHLIALTNALIISLTVTIANLLNNYILMFIVGLVLLFPQIILYYHLIGKYYQKKEGKNHD
jgi:hypothetical protein